jgi:hypothetical protein
MTSARRWWLADRPSRQDRADDLAEEVLLLREDATVTSVVSRDARPFSVGKRLAEMVIGPAR